MKTITVSAKKDFLERLASVAPMKALSELIWNGLDAGSDLIEVELEQNRMSGLDRIRVRDHGSGIPHDKVESYFGDLGNSWKSAAKRFKGRSLHGSKGEGRFKAFALGNHVEWNTVYKNGGSQSYRYQIIGRAESRERPAFSEPVAANGDHPGTEVLISGIEKVHGALLEDTAIEELAKQFAAYLSKYPKVVIRFNGVAVDPSTIQDRIEDIQLPEVDLGGGRKIAVDISIIEWKTPTKRIVHLCDNSGVCLHETEAGVQIRAPGFHFTAFIKTDHFRKLNQEGLLVVEELSPDVDAILKASKKAIRGYFRKRLAEQHIPAVERWKAENIYPYEEKGPLNPVEEAERQVFDIIAVKVESYLPDFDESDIKSKQFVFRLLAQALHQNPESVQQIITEVLKLKPREQEDLADLLKKTSFQAIITSAKTVANRLDFLVGLENLLFDKATKKKLLERDQLHKILESEAWIFDEDFALSGSEERLEEVLEKHIGLLGERADGGKAVVVGDDKTGRIDVMLNRVITPRSGEMDYLVVELKRPSKKVDDDVITQTKKYAMAVAGDERFRGVPAKWKFIAISNELNDYAKRDSTQTGRPRGQVWASENGDITVWVREWAEVINTARARLNFVNASLSYEANRKSAREYLMKAHAKFIPQTGSVETDEAEEDGEGNEGEVQ
jgi:hypothetical protein